MDKQEHGSLASYHLVYRLFLYCYKDKGIQITYRVMTIIKHSAVCDTIMFISARHTVRVSARLMRPTAERFSFLLPCGLISWFTGTLSWMHWRRGKGQFERRMHLGPIRITSSNWAHILLETHISIIMRNFFIVLGKFSFLFSMPSRCLKLRKIYFMLVRL